MGTKVHVEQDDASLGANTASRPLQIALAGNPNVGKSVIFNALTGLNADVSNYPGTTIDVARGKLGQDNICDTPGVYGVSSFNDEERAARKMILEADLVINVVSALSLDRDLFLTLQLSDMGKKMILVINQWDEAQHRNIKIDTAMLGELLGLPVLTCVAVRNEGVQEIGKSLHLAKVGKIGDETVEFLQPLIENNIKHAHAMLIAEGDEASATEHGTEPLPHRTSIYGSRRMRVNSIIEQCVVFEGREQTTSAKIGRTLLHPIWGPLISIAVCYLIFYQMLGVWIAGNLVDITEKKGMKVYYEPVVRRIVGNYFPVDVTVGEHVFKFPAGISSAHDTERELSAATSKASPSDVTYNFWAYRGIMACVGNILVGEYGLLTLTVTYLLGLLMPLVIGFYLGLSLLEDSGYLPRLAVIVDRLMNKIGLNGRAIIPLILGLGCVTMATITTRLLTSTREKIIATALLGVAIPCSAQLGVVSGTLAHSGGPLAWSVYGFIVASILAVTGVVLNMVLPGKSGGLIIDLPPMRLPRWDNIFKKTWKKSRNFLEDATPMFFIAGFVVTVAQMTGLLDWFISVLRPITVSWLRLPDDPRVATTFILGIVRRDFASFGLTEVNMTAVQAVTAMIVITLFVPCIATVGVMIKERGPKIALTIWIGSWLCAFVIGGILAHALPPLFHLLKTN